MSTAHTLQTVEKKTGEGRLLVRRARGVVPTAVEDQEKACFVLTQNRFTHIYEHIIIPLIRGSTVLSLTRQSTMKSPFWSPVLDRVPCLLSGPLSGLQPTSQRANQPASRPVNQQPGSQAASQPGNQATSQPTNRQSRKPANR